MKLYLENEVQKFALENSYYSLFNDKSMNQHLTDITGLTTADIGHIREQVKAARRELDDLNSKDFVFRELQKLIGVFR